MRATRALSVFIIVGILAGCGASRQSAYLETGDAVKKEAAKPAPVGAEAPAAVAFKKAEELWAKRHSPAKLLEALALYKEVVKLNPDHRDALARLTRGYYLHAYGYAKTKEAILAAYDEGARWGERMMGLNPKFREKIAAEVNDDEALSVCTKEDVRGIYWAYANLGKWSVMQGFTTVLANKGKLKAFVSRVAELDEKYYYGAGHRGLLAFYAKAPSFAGGDLNKAKQHYDASMKIAPDYFGTKVTMAQYYATKKQDRALFKKVLEEVIAGDPKVLPDVYAMQVLSQKKAAELLKQIDDLFDE